MRQALAVLACTLPATGAQALSVATMPPHDPANASCAVTSLVDYINGEWDFRHGRTAEQPEDRSGLVLALDEARSLSAAELVEAMRSVDGHEDREPLTATRLVRLVDDDHWPVYLLQFRRYNWYSRFDEGTGLMDEGYEVDTSTWIASYMSNTIWRLRRADELDSLARSGADVLGRCNRDAIPVRAPLAVQAD